MQHKAPIVRGGVQGRGGGALSHERADRHRSGEEPQITVGVHDRSPQRTVVLLRDDEKVDLKRGSSDRNRPCRQFGVRWESGARGSGTTPRMTFAHSVARFSARYPFARAASSMAASMSVKFAVSILSINGPVNRPIGPPLGTYR